MGMKYTQSEAKGPSTSASRLVGRRAREWVVLMEESCMLNGGKEARSSYVEVDDPEMAFAGR